MQDKDMQNKDNQDVADNQNIADNQEKADTQNKEAEMTDFREAIGVKILERGVGFAKGEIDILPWHLNVLGVVHGGCLFSLADTISGVSALGRGGRVTTVNGSINYLKAGKNTSKVVAEAREIKYGRTLSVCECKLSNDKGELLATTTMTFFHLPEA